MKTTIAFIIICICLFGIGCSSLPKTIEPRSLAFAGMKMKAAREAQKQQDFARAVELYKDAYDYFTRIDDIKGKIDAGLSIARQYFYLGKPMESREWLNRASTLIETGMPQMAASKAVLEIEMAFEKENYPEVIRIADNTSSSTSTLNIEWQMEILCYAMISKWRLKQDYQTEFQRIQTVLPALKKLFDKRKIIDAEVLSLAYYYTGYIYTVEENWQIALDNFGKAKVIDGLVDNAYGLGKNLYAMGRCYEKLGFPGKASSSYERSAEIFDLLKDDDMATKAKKRSKSIGKKEGK
ncbi:MAG: hypothetical protein GY940_47445 [bacterium]|nr:hypothetical protein [bacterium]